MKILIVDDNDVMREMIRSFLPESCDEIRECDKGVDTLDCYRAFLPDWVIMDWEMKPLDGLAVLRQILGGYPDAKILLVTQYDEPELSTTAQEAGAKGLILKDQLLALRRFLPFQL